MANEVIYPGVDDAFEKIQTSVEELGIPLLPVMMGVDIPERGIHGALFVPRNIFFSQRGMRLTGVTYRSEDDEHGLMASFTLRHRGMGERLVRALRRLPSSKTAFTIDYIDE